MSWDLSVKLIAYVWKLCNCYNLAICLNTKNFSVILKNYLNWVNRQFHCALKKINKTLPEDSCYNFIFVSTQFGWNAVCKTVFMLYPSRKKKESPLATEINNHSELELLSALVCQIVQLILLEWSLGYPCKCLDVGRNVVWKFWYIHERKFLW